MTYFYLSDKHSLSKTRLPSLMFLHFLKSNPNSNLDLNFHTLIPRENQTPFKVHLLPEDLKNTWKTLSCIRLSRLYHHDHRLPQQLQKGHRSEIHRINLLLRHPPKSPLHQQQQINRAMLRSRRIPHKYQTNKIDQGKFLLLIRPVFLRVTKTSHPRRDILQ